MEERPQTRPLPAPNPVTQQAHRHQSFWQIKLPLAIGVGLALIASAGTIVATVRGAGGISRWASISLIWLILQITPLVLILIGVTAAMVYLLSVMIPVVPRYMRLLWGYFILARGGAERLSRISVEPFLRVHSIAASIRAFWDALLHKSG